VVRRSSGGSSGEGGDLLDFGKYEVMSFDCYGTLIDWESGIVSGMRPVLERQGIEATDEEILGLHARTESELQSASKRGAYVKYRKVLGDTVRRFGEEYGFEPELSEVSALADSLRDWKSFPDTVEALRALKGKYELAIITNADDGLFALSACHLEVEFDYIITAEQAGTYKPSLDNFELALERIGVPPGKLLHVAQSLFHDHVPAKEMGLDTVWVNRRKGKKGFGATPPASAEPDLEVPDLATLVEKLDATGP
jgi:2-haloacid dehalogenase